MGTAGRGRLFCHERYPIMFSLSGGTRNYMFHSSFVTSYFRIDVVIYRQIAMLSINRPQSLYFWRRFLGISLILAPIYQSLDTGRAAGPRSACRARRAADRGLSLVGFMKTNAFIWRRLRPPAISYVTLVPGITNSGFARSSPGLGR